MCIVPEKPLNQENNKTQFHINTDEIVHNRLQQANYHFSSRAGQHMAWVLKTGRGKMLANAVTGDKTSVQTAEQHLHELMDSILAHAKSRNEINTISFASIDIACREKIGKIWPF
jgi:hypothetical protein